MPGIGDFQYGYDAAGLDAYLEEIKTGALVKAQDAVMNTGEIVSTCEAEWEGKARENFVTNLEKDAQHVSDQFESLFNVLSAEVKATQAAMANKDEELINVG